MHTTKYIRRLAFATLTSVAAGTVLVATSETTSAPEPASLTASLGSVTGYSAVAIYSYSYIPTSVLQWPDTWKPGTAQAGTPCSNIALSAGSRTTRTIQALGSQRRCV
ncbi:MAG: hypothetical protein ACKVZ0_15695 [Gemmatimonadales bacterium]